MVVFAVGSCRRMMGLRRATSPRFITHSIPGWVSDATNVAEWVGLRPGRTSRSALRRGRARDQFAAHVSLNGSPVIGMLCMMTASLRATATAAGLKPSRSRSCSPHLRKSHSDRLRTSNTVAVSESSHLKWVSPRLRCVRHNRSRLTGILTHGCSPSDVWARLQVVSPHLSYGGAATFRAN